MDEARGMVRKLAENDVSSCGVYHLHDLRDRLKNPPNPVQSVFEKA